MYLPSGQGICSKENKRVEKVSVTCLNLIRSLTQSIFVKSHVYTRNKSFAKTFFCKIVRIAWEEIYKKSFLLSSIDISMQEFRLCWGRHILS